MKGSRMSQTSLEERGAQQALSGRQPAATGALWAKPTNRLCPVAIPQACRAHRKREVWRVYDSGMGVLRAAAQAAAAGVGGSCAG